MSRRFVIAAVLALPALLYSLTLYPGVGGRGNTGDSAKFQYIGEVLGVPHQPGYPQYVMLNFLWTRIPLPMELATRVNLLSAVFTLAAGVFLFLLYRRLAGRTVPAVLATWTVMLARTVWSYSTEAEVYSLHLLWIAAVSWALCVFTRERARHWLVAVLVLYAFSFGNHPTMITLLPGLAAVLFALEGKRLFERRLVAVALTAIALSLAQYGYVLWRSHSEAPFVEGIGREADLNRLADSMSGDRFTSKNLLRRGESELVGRLTGAPIETARQLGPIVLLLALPGLASAFRRKEPLRWYLVLGILGPTAFIAAYHIGDWEAYLTPAWVMVGGLAAIGGGRWLERPAVRAVVLAGWAALLALTVSIDFRALRVEENEYDRALLVAAAGRDAYVVAYRGPGYKSKQLNNYHRFGLHLEENRNLHFLTAREVFEEEYAFLDDLPLYFRGKRVKRFFDRHRVDYVQRWLNQDPLSDYFVTGTSWPIDRLTIAPRAGGGIEIRVSADYSLTDAEPAELEVAVIDGRTRRTRGVALFTFEDAWSDDPKVLGLNGFIDKIARGDWVFLLAQGPALGDNTATLHKILTHMHFPPDMLISPRHTAVVAGRKGVAGSALAVADPVEPIVVELRTR